MVPHGKAQLPHLARRPADPGAQEQPFAAVLDFQHLSPPGSHGRGDKPAGFLQHLVQIVRMQREIREIRQHLLALQHGVQKIALRHLQVSAFRGVP